MGAMGRRENSTKSKKRKKDSWLLANKMHTIERGNALLGWSKVYSKKGKQNSFSSGQATSSSQLEPPTPMPPRSKL